jgi:hypothetical protein
LFSSDMDASTRRGLGGPSFGGADWLTVYPAGSLVGFTVWTRWRSWAKYRTPAQ